MKSIPKRTIQIITIIGLLLIITLVDLSYPVKSAALQTPPTPTPTPTQVYLNGEPVLKTGDTEGLIIGGAVILIIILSGVIIQRLIQKKSTYNGT